MISLKNLKLCSLSFLTATAICLTSFAEAAPCPEKKKCLSKNDLIYRTDAIQQGINTIGTFTLGFSAAVRETNPTAQAALVLALEETLTTPFSITLILNASTEIVATDHASLLAMIQSFSSTLSFDSSLTGNFSVVNYTRNCPSRLRNLQFNALEYIVQTPTGDPSVLLTALDQYTVVETSCDVFKIQTLVSTVIGEVPMCCFIP